ncbi:GDSL-type esterase/lipase family protein [Pedobacter caeni]|uniref:Lysophospholipase L1 n=1 Tax=Pedobacter caeni TaxID=288992 RepID=A0A1M5DZE4_9SPHI|nr:GDSL-type esterase/lipase family protein [Pedobacter caeni]SHF72398.1 Lysophospholipase L1 [Pedobacter caeni]
MKKACYYLIGGCLIFLLTPLGLNAQTVKWDSTSRAKKYSERLEQFKTDPISKKDFIFLGNSITAGTNWAALLDLPIAKNRGISGDITFGVLDRLSEIIAANPKKIFILIGINDISKGIPDSIILRNYKRMIQRILTGSKSQIYFSTLLPVNNTMNTTNKHRGKDEHITWLNKELKKLVQKRVTVIDLYPHFTDTENRLKESLTYDGLHLNDAGYQEWAKILKEGNYLR